MKDKILRLSDFAIYWSIIIMPFSVAIAPAIANTFIGFFSAFFIIKRLITRKAFTTDRLTLFFFLLFLTVSAISFRNSVSYSTSFQGIVKLLKYILIFLVCSEEIRDKRHISRIIISICSGVCLASLDALWQMAFGYDFIHHIGIQAAIGLPRPTAAFPNPNVFGIYMTALTPLIFGLALLYFKGKKRLFMFLPAILGAAGIYLTLSRGAGLAIYLAVLFLCVAGKKKLFTAGLVAILIIYPFVMPKNIKQWAKDSRYNPMILMCGEERVSIQNNTINMIKHHPFIGVGVNTFSRNYGKYKTAEAEKYAPTPDTIYAHNIYLQMAGETGLLGLLAFILFLFQVFRRAFKTLPRLNDGYLKITALSLIACMIAFLINGLTETSLYYPRVAMIFWYLIGLSLALGKFANPKENAG
ncbi:hypothetical protein EPN54_05665 [bacterium]|nr:MAG: hypothetical protein EPN54_05665 [bacterium]